MIASPPRHVGIIGAGAWGTALAIQVARAGHRPFLWGRPQDDLPRMARERRNARFLPDCPFPDVLTIETDAAALANGATDLIVVVPSQGFVSTLQIFAPLIGAQHRMAWATKGLEPGSGRFLHEVATDLLGPKRPLAVLSGPTFAREVGLGLPSAITIAATDDAFAADLALCLQSPGFRAYTSHDMLGVELGGAIKNVIAIAAGMSDGLGFGANARAALITRGLAEMIRLGIALGASAETFSGLSGVGDLVLTCTDDQSRNRQLGLALGRGEPRLSAEQRIGLVEGTHAAAEVRRLAERMRVETPITEHVQRILNGEITPQQAVEILMSRSPKAEPE